MQELQYLEVNSLWVTGNWQLVTGAVVAMDVGEEKGRSFGNGCQYWNI